MTEKYIVNVVTYATLDATGSWTCSGIPQADECCIRQIICESSNPVLSTRLIYSTLTNAVIGSAANVAFCSNPGTRIQLRQHSTDIAFQLRNFDGTNVSDAVGETVAISMDFIKY